MTFRTTIAILAASLLGAYGAAEELTICYPTRSGASWPLFLAKEGGYYAKYDVGVAIIATAGILLTWLAERLERRFSRWRPSR